MLGAFAPLGLILILYPLAFALALWAIIDAATRPNQAFQIAGTSKALWITLVVVFSIFCGVVGIVLSIVYLASIRPRVKRAQDAMPSPAPYYGVPAPMTAAQAAPGWYPDPTNPGLEWYWDGWHYTSSRPVAAPPAPPPPTAP